MKVKVTLLVLSIVGVAFLLFEMVYNEHPTFITAKKAEAVATKLYGGKVLETRANKADYQISLENDRGLYELHVDANTEKIYDIKLIKRKDTPLTLEEAVGRTGQKHTITDDLTNNGVTAVPLTKQEAKAIALKQLDGQITNISTVSTEKGLHYIVTVNGKKETANVYVQSNSGIVTSTVWKKHDDENDDDPNDPDDHSDDDVDDDRPEKDDSTSDPE
ncbi:PepSY domain-containing protein [Aneurinibacillus sp. REN35]|uniref:PepSY domain-containing protein n=1 Tax=Aneurinibacillus sp. REN35 TaxID=3237286 RepID=UPI003526D67B